MCQRRKLTTRMCLSRTWGSGPAEAASGNAQAKMRWTTTAYYGTPCVTFVYGVVLVGWPQDLVPFGTPPARMRSLAVVTELMQCFKTGTTRFEKQTEAEMEVLARRERSSLHSRRVDAGRRMDTGSRPLRPVETRSKRLRKHDLWSSRLVKGRED